MFNRFQGVLPPCFYRILSNCEAVIFEINLDQYVLQFFSRRTCDFCLLVFRPGIPSTSRLALKTSQPGHQLPAHRRLPAVLRAAMLCSGFPCVRKANCLQPLVADPHFPSRHCLPISPLYQLTSLCGPSCINLASSVSMRPCRAAKQVKTSRSLHPQTSFHTVTLLPWGPTSGWHSLNRKGWNTTKP